MAKARLYFDGDNSGIEKEARIYSLTQEVEDKLDSISNFQSEIDDLQDQINNLASRGRYLSTWNTVTGLPETNPQVDPYVYRAGDYYIVSVVGGTNYRPQGSEYHIGVASQALETQLVEVNDLYIYDGVQWIKQGSGSSVNVTWGSIAGALSNQTDLQNALNDKANKTDVLEKTNTTSYTPTGDYNPATKKYVDDNDTFIGATAPTNNVIEGRLWYDTAADVLKVYNGSQWVPTGKTYTAGSHINISNADVISTTGLQEELIPGKNVKITFQNVINAEDTVYSAGENITIQDGHKTESYMKGPCLSGWHIPSKDEADGVATIFNSLTFTETDPWVTVPKYLHLPGAGCLRYGNGDVSFRNQHYCCWTSSHAENSAQTQMAIYFGYRRRSGAPNLGTATDRAATGLPIRPFKNEFVAPDSSWTVINGTLGSAGIFRDQTNGLITITGDGTTGYTMADKNLGATTVYNYGDTLSEANCGGYFQRGNNYMFPFGGGQPITDVHVNVYDSITHQAIYGPENPYYSPVFVKTLDASRFDPRNYGFDMWGGHTGGTFQEVVPNVISATDTTYTAGTGINIDSNNEISVDTSVVATQTDLQDKQGLLTAGDNITIEDVCTTESDTKGPAPSGFHVPLNTEWQAVYDIWTALGGGNGTNFGIALKLPFAGYRDFSSAGVYNQGTNGNYWSSSRRNADYAYHLFFGSTAISSQNYSYRASGFSVRCFKNSPVVPTSTWTKLYGTSIEAGGIFWSFTDGLISLSSDGNTWVTIADKNLGATTVWNSGDTLSEANCGKYYQWGNNYGFPFTGSVTTSSTQVDASNYGPGNYYSSSTFIKYTGRWDSTDNGNLWGGVTQGTFQDCIHNVISATVPSVSVVSDDIGVTYHITVSNSDPASGTASNIITLVP